VEKCSTVELTLPQLPRRLAAHKQLPEAEVVILDIIPSEVYEHGLPSARH
jgi:hypothetical protein